MAFAEKCGNHAGDQHHQEPRGEQQNAGSQGRSGDDLLNQAAQLLNHAETVRSLNPGALKLVVEQRVFVGGQIQPGSVMHDAHADVADKFVGQQSVTVIDNTIQDGGQAGEAKFEGYQPPKIACEERGGMRKMRDNRIDNQASPPPAGQWEKGQ